MARIPKNCLQLTVDEGNILGDLLEYNHMDCNWWVDGDGYLHDMELNCKYVTNTAVELQTISEGIEDYELSLFEPKEIEVLKNMFERFNISIDTIPWPK